MNNSGILINFSLLMLFLSCAREGTPPTLSEQSKKAEIIQLNAGEKLLSEARKRMQKKTTATPENIEAPNLGQISKLTALAQKSNYDTVEIKKFLKITPEAFKNDAEFSQLYNETLFRIMDKEPKKFVKTTINATESTRQNIDVQIKSPVNDRVNVNRVKSKLQGEVQLQWQVREPKIESNNKQVLTKEHTKYQSLNNVFDARKRKLKEPRKLIEIRRTDSIRRSSSIRPQLRAQPAVQRRTLDTVQRRRE